MKKTVKVSIEYEIDEKQYYDKDILKVLVDCMTSEEFIRNCLMARLSKSLVKCVVKKEPSNKEIERGRK